MPATSLILQFAMIILTLQVFVYCHGVNANVGNNMGSPSDDTKSVILNPQWSKLWGIILKSHHDDDSASNLKITRSKKRAADDYNYEQYRKDWYAGDHQFPHYYCSGYCG